MSRTANDNRCAPFDAVIFDLDGVIAKTASAHAASWKLMFDEYLKERAGRTGEPFREFDDERDHRPYIEGRPRYEGVASFLKSRGIRLPYGAPDDPPGKETVCGLGNQKNVKFREILKTQGIAVYDSTLKAAENLKARGIKIAVASSSRNCREVLKSAGLENLFAALVDGEDAAGLGLEGKPSPDIFLKAAEKLGVEPGRAVVIEDSVSGVQAGRQGGFALVIGLARNQNEAQLRANGADVVVADFAGVDYNVITRWCRAKSRP